MIKHKRLADWENKLKLIFDEIDDFLEDKYGKLYPLHPSRAARGKTSNKESDGLFDVGASFSLGVGSKYGKGYVVDVRFVTLGFVPEDIQVKINNDVKALLEKKLPNVFPDREMRVVREGTIYKIIGDLSLGNA